jgi:hypothetical protein
VLDLQNPKISFILLSSDRLDDMTSILYAKDYTIIPIQSFYKGQYENSILAFSGVDNDELRKDLIFLLNHFHQECGIIKYRDESIAKKVFRDGQEKPLSIVLYNTDSDNTSYLYNGLSFSFLEQVRYWKPTKIGDFKKGMLVEYLNNNKWYQQIVSDPINEYENIYKLLIKYDKIRVAAK